jgi:hypothetical protein
VLATRGETGRLAGRSTEPIVAVNLGGRVTRLYQRPIAPLGDRDVSPTGQLQHPQTVGGALHNLDIASNRATDDLGR